MADRDALLADLDGARGAFHEVLASVDLDLATVPGVMEDWSVRDIVYHLAAWCEHGSQALALATAGRGDEFAYSTGDTDAMNERFLAEGRAASPTDALRREESAFTAFRERIARLDPSHLGSRLGNGDTVEAVIAYDGPEHYQEHTAHLRAWFGPDAGDED
jgi:Mycothiol maleylpyruvate isomerase N-terminal domain